MSHDTRREEKRRRVARGRSLKHVEGNNNNYYVCAAKIYGTSVLVRTALLRERSRGADGNANLIA